MVYKVAVLVAMQEEVDFFLKNNKVVKIESDPFLIYEYNDNLIVISGIGLINAASCATYIQNKYTPKSFMNIGLAGSVFNDLNILDTVIVDKVYNGGTDATIFGYKYGQTPKEEHFFSSDSNLLSILKSCEIDEQRNLVSTSSFISSLEMKKTLIDPINENIALMDMEGFGFFQICHKFKVPIVAVKVVSDILDKKEDNNLQFVEILTKGSQIISEVMVKYLK